MSDQANFIISRLDKQAYQYLYLLSRKGVHARPAHTRNGVVPVLRIRSAGIKHAGDCPQSIWTKFVAMGLVSSTGSTQNWQLTRFGKEVAKLAAVRVNPEQRNNKSQQNRRRLGDGVSVTCNERESPLAWLARRKGRDGKPMVSEEQFQAGERLRRDFFRANLNPKVTMDWSMALSAGGSRRCGGADQVMLSDMAIAAREKVNSALEAVGPELASILIDVCCHLKGLEASEQAAGWPRRSGKVILQLALTRLARHYGLMQDDDMPTGRNLGLIRHWGGADYRPRLDVEPSPQGAD